MASDQIPKPGRPFSVRSAPDEQDLFTLDECGAYDCLHELILSRGQRASLRHEVRQPSFGERVPTNNAKWEENGMCSMGMPPERFGPALYSKQAGLIS
jgi:hypothetical protein